MLDDLAPTRRRASFLDRSLGGASTWSPAAAAASRRDTRPISAWPAKMPVWWWRLGGLGTFAHVKGSSRVDRSFLVLRWPWLAAIAVVWLFGLASLARAEPAPVQPVKPTPVKPVGTPAQPAPKPVAPATTTEPAPAQPATPPAAPATTPQPASGPDPFAATPGSGAGGGTHNPNVRESELYGDRLDNLQGEVDELKDKIFRSKARLTLLKETVLKGVLAGSRVTIAHQNLMGSGFRLTRVVVSMDGAQIFARTDETGSLDGEDEFVVYDGNLPPGPHAVTVKLEYQGHGYGVFAYLNGYTFTSSSTHSFTAPENGALKLVSQGFEKGNMTTEMRDRPAVNWQEVPLDAAGRPLPKTRRGARGKKDAGP
jgi:hypothetical protein